MSSWQEQRSYVVEILCSMHGQSELIGKCLDVKNKRNWETLKRRENISHLIKRYLDGDDDKLVDVLNFSVMEENVKRYKEMTQTN